MFSSALLFVIGLSTSLPDAWSALKPQAQFRLRYEEIIETNRDEGGLALDFRLGIFPQLNSTTQWGLEFRTADNEMGADPGSVPLGSAFTGKSLSVSQVYLGFQLKPSARSEFRWVMGKFQNPMRVSPLTWDSDLNPEGFYQDLTLYSSDQKIRFRFQTAQFSADRVSPSITNSTPIRRSWLFTGGPELRWQQSQTLSLVGSIHQNFLVDPSERLKNLASLRGNSIRMESSDLREDFAPIEAIAMVETLQFGVRASFEISGALNWLSDNEDRGFLARIQVGNSFRKNSFESSISYLYSEPNIQLASFLDRDWGYANRKGVRLEANYFPDSNLRIGGIFGSLQNIEKNLIQDSWLLAALELEYRF